MHERHDHGWAAVVQKPRRNISQGTSKLIDGPPKTYFSNVVAPSLHQIRYPADAAIVETLTEGTLAKMAVCHTLF